MRRGRSRLITGSRRLLLVRVPWPMRWLRPCNSVCQKTPVFALTARIPGRAWRRPTAWRGRFRSPGAGRGRVRPLPVHFPLVGSKPPTSSRIWSCNFVPVPPKAAISRPVRRMEARPSHRIRPGSPEIRKRCRGRRFRFRGHFPATTGAITDGPVLQHLDSHLPDATGASR